MHTDQKTIFNISVFWADILHSFSFFLFLPNLFGFSRTLLALEQRFEPLPLRDITSLITPLTFDTCYINHNVRVNTLQNCRIFDMIFENWLTFLQPLSLLAGESLCTVERPIAEVLESLKISSSNKAMHSSQHPFILLNVLSYILIAIRS